MLSTVTHGMAAALAAPLLIGLGPVTTAQAAAATAPPDARLAVTAVDGTGCRPGQAITKLDPAGRSGVVTFNRFQASLESTPVNCEVTINVTAPAGWGYRLAQVKLSGRKEFGPGVQGKVATYIKVPGERTRYGDLFFVAGQSSQTWEHPVRPPSTSFTGCGAGSAVTVVMADEMRRFTTSGPAWGRVATEQLAFGLDDVEWKPCAPTAR